jgi:isoamylase
MLLAGDELGNSQSGNNNAYCQDNEIGWVDWSGERNPERDLSDFVARLIALRRKYGLAHERFLHGEAPPDRGRKDIAWYRADGAEMAEPDWLFPDARFLAVVLDGTANPTLIFFNAHFEPLRVTVPTVSGVEAWRIEINTAEPDGTSKEKLTPGQAFDVPERSLVCMLGPTG